MMIVLFILLCIAFGFCLGFYLYELVFKPNKSKQSSQTHKFNYKDSNKCRCKNRQDQQFCDFYECGRCDGEFIDI